MKKIRYWIKVRLIKFLDIDGLAQKVNRHQLLEEGNYRSIEGLKKDLAITRRSLSRTQQKVANIDKDLIGI